MNRSESWHKKKMQEHGKRSSKSKSPKLQVATLLCVCLSQWAAQSRTPQDDVGLYLLEGSQQLQLDTLCKLRIDDCKNLRLWAVCEAPQLVRCEVVKCSALERLELCGSPCMQRLDVSQCTELREIMTPGR